MAAREANPGTPGAYFGNPEELCWIEKTIPVSPALPVDMSFYIWNALYRAIRLNEPFPITLDEAVDTMHIISTAKAGTRFEAVGV